ncbi:MAG TPA: extracellular solute-binding protein [Candidatus Hydrogenedentes bacterium]|nr:extracellular solute-binding protein [Candidatus Hydrogenedentota bacterium]HPJ98280.1 extracellular solute-binding protein [Candidatus Hydrogenedentota bacterium]
MRLSCANLCKRNARLHGRALLFLAAAIGGCLASPEPLSPDEALARAHIQITRLLQEELTRYPEAIDIEAPEAVDNPAAVTLWYPAHSIIAPALGNPEIRRAFDAAHPGIELKPQFIGDWHVAIQKLTVSIAAGGLPDIAIVERSWAARLAQAGRLMPLDGFLDVEMLDDFHPNARAAYTLQGRIWALPADGFCSVLFFNRAAVADPPKTWEELPVQISETKAVIGHLPYIEMLWSAGGRVCEHNQSGLTAPSAMRALHFLLSLRDTGQSDAQMLADPAWGFAAFMKNSAPMTAASSEWLVRTRDAAFPAGMAALPGAEGPISRVGDMAIVVFAKHAAAKHDAIVAALDWLTGPAVQGAAAAARGSMPVRQSVAETVDIPPGLRAAYTAAQAPPFAGVWSAAEYELSSNLARVWQWKHESPESEASRHGGTWETSPSGN